MRDLGVSPSFLIGHVYYWGQFSSVPTFVGLTNASS
jgi:hypothetical protein